MRIETNLDLAEYNSYRLHSIAEIAYFPDTLEELKGVVDRDSIIIGGGCNLILTKEVYTSPVVFIKNNYSGIKQNGNTLIVKAGTDLQALSEYARDHSLSGLEYYYDIPGCVGGATIMNAGCNGQAWGDLVSKVTIFDVDDQTVSMISKKDMHFEYRGNVLKDIKSVVLDVELMLKPGNRAEITSVMESNKRQRWAKQPRNYPSAGSVFRRPPGFFVGQMITEVGLKGYRIGGAMISDKHAGFIVNCGNATASDIVALIKLAQTRVKECFNIDLELEQRLV